MTADQWLARAGREEAGGLTKAQEETFGGHERSVLIVVMFPRCMHAS